MTTNTAPNFPNLSETAHDESPVTGQGAEYIDNNNREFIRLCRSSKVEAGKAQITWVVRDRETDVLSERDDIVPVEHVLDYIEQEILFESEEDITVTLSAN